MTSRLVSSQKKKIGFQFVSLYASTLLTDRCWCHLSAVIYFGRARCFEVMP